MKITAFVVLALFSVSPAFADGPCDGHADRATYEEARISIDQVLSTSARLRGNVMSVYVGTCNEAWMAEGVGMETDEVPNAEYCGVRIELSSYDAIAGFAASALLTGPEMPWGTEGQTVPFCVGYRGFNRSH